MKIGIAGLGLIGGSMAKALKKHTGYKVYGWNRTLSVAETALADGFYTIGRTTVRSV